MTSAPRRVRGSLIVAIAAVVAAAMAAGAWLTLAGRPESADIIDLAAIDAEHAVLVRNVRRDPERSFVALTHSQRGQLWDALIPRYPAALRDQKTGLAITFGVIAARGVASDTVDIMAFAATEGRKLGRVTLARGRADDTGSRLLHAGSVAGDAMTFEFFAVPGGSAVAAIDLQRGQTLWQLELGKEPVGPVWLRERQLLVYQPGLLRILDRRAGAAGRAAPGDQTTASMAMDPWPCVLADTVYGSHAGALRAVSLDELAVRDVAALPPGRLVGACGRRGDRDILAMQGASSTGMVWAVDRATGQPAWSIDLEAPLLAQDALILSTPDAAPLAGMLPRFVPMLVGDAGAAALVMLDLEAGRVAWRSAARPGLGKARIMTAAAATTPTATTTATGSRRHHLWLPETQTLAVLDGDTGALSAAVSLNGYAEVWPRHLAEDRVWIHGGTRWAVLDGATLALVAGHGAVTPLSQMREALARELSVPLVP